MEGGKENKCDLRQAAAFRTVGFIGHSTALVINHVVPSPIMIHEDEWQHDERDEHDCSLNRITERDRPLPANHFAEEDDEADAPSQCSSMQLACVTTSAS